MQADQIASAYHQALSLWLWLQSHPEVEEAYPRFYGASLDGEISQAAHEFELTHDAGPVLSMIDTISRRLRKLAAPMENWN
jgi:hypothetical protein